MKRKLSLILPLLFFSLVYSACSTVGEEDEPITTDANGNVISRVEDGTITATDSIDFRMLITDSVSKRWTTNLFTLAGSTDFTACRLDDIMLMFADGTYTYQGGQLCGAEDNLATRNGRWELDYNNNKIYFDRGTSNEYEAEVIGLKSDELRVKGSYMGMEIRALYSFN